MPVQTLSEALDNLYTTTWLHMKDQAIDNIFDATPFWFWMRDKNKLKSKTGGRYILEPVVYAKNENVVWLTRGGTVALNDYEFLTEAVYEWRYMAVPIVRFGIDDQKNAGPTKIMDYAKAKLANAQDSAITELETRLFAASGSADNAIDGLQLLVADDPTAAATVGGIAQNTYSWWRNQTINMTGVSFGTSGVARMRTMVNRCQNNRQSDRPDIILSGQTPFEYYESEILEPWRFTDKKMADVGFESLSFKGIPMVWSPSAANTRMYFLNSRFLTFVYDPRMYFDMTEWKPIPEQVNDRAAQIATACSFITNRRRVHGVMHTIDTA